jgi:acyl carrier protein
MSLNRDELISMAREAVVDALEERGVEIPADLGLDTVIFGKKSLLDSLGLVTLVMELENRLDEERGIQVVLADEKAMSRRSSPFRTLGSLVDYVEERIKKAGDG